MCQGDTGEEEVSWALGKTGLSPWVGTVICQLSGHTDRDRQDGFPSATSPWAASGLEGSTGERGKEMPEAFILLPGASPSFFPLKLSSDLRSLPQDQVVF